MKAQFLIEVIATNTETGHVAVSQKTVDFDLSRMRPTKAKEHLEFTTKALKAHLAPRKVGDILIIHNVGVIVGCAPVEEQEIFSYEQEIPLELRVTTEGPQGISFRKIWNFLRGQ